MAQAAAAAKAARGSRGGGGLAALFGGAKAGKESDVASKVEARARKAERAAQAAAAKEAAAASGEEEEAAAVKRPSLLSRPRPVVAKAEKTAVSCVLKSFVDLRTGREKHPWESWVELTRKRTTE